MQENICCDVMPYGPNEVRSVRHDVTTNIFRMDQNSRLIRALLYTHTSTTTKNQCFPLLLWTEAQPVHTPVRTQVYGPALSQSNFSILSVFCLVYNKSGYSQDTVKVSVLFYVPSSLKVQTTVSYLI